MTIEQTTTTALSAPSFTNIMLNGTYLPLTPANTTLQRPSYELAQSINPLIAAAGPIINLVPRLRKQQDHDNIQHLQQQLIEEIKCFEVQALQQHYPEESILMARYALCTVLDDTICHTRWGKYSDWSQYSLLPYFHGQTSGGSALFSLLNSLKQHAKTQIDLLEFMYVVLSLGYQGLHAAKNSSKALLGNLTDELFQHIKQVRGDSAPQLANLSNFLPELKPAPPLPLWIIGLFTAALIFTIYTAFNYVLNTTTSPLYRTLASIQAEAGNVPK